MGSTSSVAVAKENISYAPMDWIAKSSLSVSMLRSENFTPVSPIGKGRFGNVFLMKEPNGKHVAVKFIPKNLILESDGILRMQQEIAVLQKVCHPFIAHWFGSFETRACIALVFSYAYGGELFTRMKKVGKFPEQVAKFYFCEIALTLHYLHDSLNIVYRDLKPENILIDETGHIRLCDFGFSVPMHEHDSSSKKTVLPESLNDGCGTAMYVAPEIAGGFMKASHSFPVDWWSLGCILYEMIFGTAPFGDTDRLNKFEIFNNINKGHVSLPFFMNMKIRSVIKGLLHHNAQKRLKWNTLKFADWMLDVRWTDFMNRMVPPPWIPERSDTPSSSHFIKWDFTIPTEATVDAIEYCRGLTIPRLMKKEPRGLYDEDGNILFVSETTENPKGSSRSSGRNSSTARAPPTASPEPKNNNTTAPTSTSADEGKGANPDKERRKSASMRRKTSVSMAKVPGPEEGKQPDVLNDSSLSGTQVTRDASQSHFQK